MEARSKENVEARSKAIRNATPRGDHFLENLYEMSNRICDLCEQPIQDFILAELEHSVSVDSFARSSLLIEEAIAQCHHPRNLRIAHYSCNGSKHNMSREEWFASGRNLQMGAPRMWTQAELLLRQFQLGENGRKGGLRSHKLHPELAANNGRTSRNKRVGVHGRSREQMVEDGRKAGRIAMDTRQFAKACALGGRAAGPMNGRKAKENQTGIFAPGFDRTKGPRASGLLSVKTGRLARIQVAASHKGGQVTGNLHKANGTGIFARSKEQRIADGRKGALKLTREQRAVAGRISGLNKKKDKTGIFGRTKEQMTADGRKGALISGNVGGIIARDKGLGFFAATFDRASARRKGMHKRWHISRGITNPDCSLCRTAAQAA